VWGTFSRSLREAPSLDDLAAREPSPAS
jgi:hypothetical protein